MDKLTAPWLKAQHCVAAVEALGADHIRFVGGAVRNSLMGLPVSDIDAATDYLPEKVMQLLSAKGFNVIPTGIEHGTVTAVLAGDVLEITTLRHDVETDGRRAKVAYTNDWQADAARRDFTMNAIYAASDGSLYDPFGGRADIAAGHIHFIGDAEERIREDALRILRLFRFHAHYGRVPLDGAALMAVKNAVSLIDGLSVERIATELNKLIVANNPVAVLSVMQGNGVLDRCIKGFPVDLSALERLSNIDAGYQRHTKALRRLFALVGARTSALLCHWNSSKKAQKHASDCAEIFASLVGMTAALIDWKKLIYRYGHASVIDCYLLAAKGVVDADIIEKLAEWDVPVFPVRGADMIELGFQPGPKLGGALKELEQYWLDRDFEPSFEALIEVGRP